MRETCFPPQKFHFLFYLWHFLLYIYLFGSHFTNISAPSKTDKFYHSFPSQFQSIPHSFFVECKTNSCSPSFMVCLAIHELYVIRIRSLRFRGNLGSVSRLRRGGDQARYFLSGLRVFSFAKPMAVEVSKGNDARATIILTSGASGRISALFSLQALRSLWLLLNAFVLLFLIPFRGRRRMASAVASGSQEKAVGKEEKATERKGAIVRVPTTMVSRKSAVDQDVAARRALAMRRVMQDDDDETVRECSLFVTPRGDTLFTQSWTPVSVKVR